MNEDQKNGALASENNEGNLNKKQLKDPSPAKGDDMPNLESEGPKKEVERLDGDEVKGSVKIRFTEKGFQIDQDGKIDSNSLIAACEVLKDNILQRYRGDSTADMLMQLASRGFGAKILKPESAEN